MSLSLYSPALGGQRTSLYFACSTVAFVAHAEYRSRVKSEVYNSYQHLHIASQF